MLRLAKWSIWTMFAQVRAFIVQLRNVDVDEVGKAIFQHCTSPKALYVTLFERWWIVGVFAFAGGCMGAHVIMNSVEAYESHGSILIYQKMPTFMDDKVMLPDPKAYDSLFATHVQLIGSPMIVERAIEHANLEEICPHVTASLDDDEFKTFEDYIRKNLKISRAGSGDSAGAFVINVGFGHTNEDEIPHVIEAVLETYSEYVNESLLFDQKNALDLVKKTTQEMEAVVNQKNERFREYLKTAPGIWNRLTENNPHQSNVEQLEKALTELEIKQISIRSRIEIMSQTHDVRTGDPLTDLDRLALIDEEDISRLDMVAKIQKDEANALAQSAYPQLQENESAKYDNLLVKYAERAQLLENIGPNHPTIIDLDASIRDTEARLAKMQPVQVEVEIGPAKLVSAYVRMLDKDMLAITNKIEFLRKQITDEIKSAQELTDFTEKAKHLETDYLRSLEVYQSIMQKTTKQSLLDQYGNFIAEIVARPHHISVTWPKKPVILALCTILGIFGGSFVALALDLIAYSPLRSVFWFIPRWILGGNVKKSTEESSGSPDG